MVQIAAVEEVTTSSALETTVAVKLENFLDFSKTWSYQVKLEGSTYVVSHAFRDDDTFDSFLRELYSETLTVFPGTYSFGVGFSPWFTKEWRA